MNAKFISMSAILLTLVLQTNTSFAEQSQGAESMLLKGGSRGDIHFPHGRHQGVTVDCMPCHGPLPKEAQVLDKMKGEGKLEKKQIMNMCKGCHKELASKGQKAGPTSCRGCHKK